MSESGVGASDIRPPRNMATASAWDPARWRGSHRAGSYDTDYVPTPQLPTPTSVNPTVHGATLDFHSEAWHDDHEDGQTREHQPMELTDSHSHGSNYHSRVDERHTPVGGSDYRRNKLDSFPRRVSTWQSLQHDDRTSDRQTTDAPLTLQIPQANGMYNSFGRLSIQQPLAISLLESVHTNGGGMMIELPRISTAYSARLHGSRSSSGGQTGPSATTSLPSFASFQKHASRPSHSDEAKIEPLSVRLSCTLCPKLEPVIAEVAVAVAELDEDLQVQYFDSVKRVCQKCTHPPRDP